jgi:hypothetical protein
VPQILNGADPGLYRVARGRPGADHLMVPDVGPGGRYMITTGEAHAVNGGTAALPNNWRRVLDVRSPAFGVFVLAVVLVLIHAHAGVPVAGAAHAGAGRK